MTNNKVYSRDKINSNNVAYANFFDYQSFLLHKNDCESHKYYNLQKKILLKLASYVIENELTDTQRRIVELVKIRGLKVKEAADFLQVNPSTISRGLRSAQKKFDRAYEHYNCVKHIMNKG